MCVHGDLFVADWKVAKQKLLHQMGQRVEQWNGMNPAIADGGRGGSDGVDDGDGGCEYVDDEVR